MRVSSCSPIYNKFRDRGSDVGEFSLCVRHLFSEMVWISRFSFYSSLLVDGEETIHHGQHHRFQFSYFFYLRWGQLRWIRYHTSSESWTPPCGGIPDMSKCKNTTLRDFPGGAEGNVKERDVTSLSSLDLVNIRMDS